MDVKVGWYTNDLNFNTTRYRGTALIDGMTVNIMNKYFGF